MIARHTRREGVPSVGLLQNEKNLFVGKQSALFPRRNAVLRAREARPTQIRRKAGYKSNHSAAWCPTTYVCPAQTLRQPARLLAVTATHRTQNAHARRLGRCWKRAVPCSLGSRSPPQSTPVLSKPYPAPLRSPIQVKGWMRNDRVSRGRVEVGGGGTMPCIDWPLEEQI